MSISYFHVFEKVLIIAKKKTIKSIVFCSRIHMLSKDLNYDKMTSDKEPVLACVYLLILCLSFFFFSNMLIKLSKHLS